MSDKRGDKALTEALAEARRTYEEGMDHGHGWEYCFTKAVEALNRTMRSATSSIAATSDEEIVQTSLRAIKDFADRGLSVSACYASIAAELRASVRLARSSIAACYDTRADEAKAILFPEAQGGISDDAYYNLMGLQYDMEHATPKDEVGIRTIKRVLDQLNRASNVLARKPVSANKASSE